MSTPTQPVTTGSAVISACGRYRYTLHRRWDHMTNPLATFVMLNPSTATADADDPTIRRCIGFAKALGCGGLQVVNLYALRSTDPKALWLAAEPVGGDNDGHLATAASWAAATNAPLIAAWGANARPDRVKAVLALPHFDRLTALGVTNKGAPRHPLYLRSSARPTPWPEMDRILAKTEKK